MDDQQRLTDADLAAMAARAKGQIEDFADYRGTGPNCCLCSIARTDVPRLLAEVAALRAERDAAVKRAEAAEGEVVVERGKAILLRGRLDDAPEVINRLLDAERRLTVDRDAARAEARRLRDVVDAVRGDIYPSESGFPGGEWRPITLRTVTLGLLAAAGKGSGEGDGQ